MKFFVSVNGDDVIVRLRAEGDDGTIGDAMFDILPGDGFAGLSYEKLKEMGSGQYDLPSSSVDSD